MIPCGRAGGDVATSRWRATDRGAGGSRLPQRPAGEPAAGPGPSAPSRTTRPGWRRSGGVLAACLLAGTSLLPRADAAVLSELQRRILAVADRLLEEAQVSYVYGG